MKTWFHRLLITTLTVALMLTLTASFATANNGDPANAATLNSVVVGADGTIHELQSKRSPELSSEDQEL